MGIRGIRGRIKRYFRGLKHCRDVTHNVDDKQHIFYFGIPMHPNLGDLAQYVCISEYLHSNYPEYKVIGIDSTVYMGKCYPLRKIIKRLIKPSDLIFFQSGYCTQDLGGIEDLMHQKVIADFPNNRLVMMPQTVYFQSASRKRQASRIYNQHKHLLFLARDEISYITAKAMFPSLPIYAYPDIVTTLIGKYDFNLNRLGILVCVRNDTEKYYSEKEINELKEKLSVIDKVEQLDTTVDAALNATSPGLKEYIENYIKNMANFRLIVTDRYHGTIFSLVANTPVIVIKTTDHKVVTGVDWFKGIYDNNVMYVDDINAVPGMAKEILYRPVIQKNNAYFEKEYYDKLRKLVETTI